jgi:AcrR family transcriptional regulator
LPRRAGGLGSVYGQEQAGRVSVTAHRSAGQRIGISREDVIRQAAELADREGVAAVTLARLALVNNVRTPTISHHVISLAQLRADIAVLAVEELAEALQLAATGKTGVDAVRAMYRAYRSYVHNFPGRYTASVETPDPRDERRLAAAGRLARHLVDVFGQIGLGGEDAMRAARLLRSAVHGYATLELKSAWQMPLDNDATFDWLLDVIINGLLGAKEKSTSRKRSLPSTNA